MVMSMISKNKFPEQGGAGVPHQAPVWAYLVAYVIPYVILFFVAIYWPERTGLFGIDFTDSKLAQVPSISAYIGKSEFPHTTAAYFVLSSVLFMPYFVLGIINPIIVFFGSINGVASHQRKVCSKSVLFGVYVFCVCSVLVASSYVQSGYQFALMPINNSRLALAFCGFVFSFYVNLYFWVGITIVNIRFLFGVLSIEVDK